ncbi:MAG TPA: preprotein translocase subunit YajC [Actinomycetota bacterium]|jgi:preprotein translocase subunit YajC|nr:preprotein translocase subunit YajC [Actinomycetota bacterium]
MLAILSQQSQANPIVAFLPLVLMGAVFYFLLIRPQSQRRRAQMQMQNELDVGDEVITTAGIYGTITEIDDDYGIITLEVAPNTEMRFSRGAVAQRLLDDDELDNEDEVEGAEPGS